MPTDPQSSSNIAGSLTDLAATQPCERAVVVSAGTDRRGRAAYRHYTFRQLNDACDCYARGFREIGFARDMPVLLMIRPGLDFYALTFALFKVGAVPVMIDPGMGIWNFMRCVATAEPKGFIGIPLAHALRLLFRKYFRSIEIPVTLGRRLCWGGHSISGLAKGTGRFPAVAANPDDRAAILFTTGSTGPAKGVTYTHRIFATQVEILRREYHIAPGDIDLPCFPLFGLFSVALGATAVIPDMDPSKPAFVDPERIIEAAENNAVTYSFGSPTLWDRVSKYCVQHNVKFTTLKKIIMAGAPVPGSLHSRLLQYVLPEGAETHTPYGATESLPVTDFQGTDMLGDTAEMTRRGAGICVGRPVRDVEVRIIAIRDDPIEEWDEKMVLPTDAIGEITVKGPVVTREYHNLPDATRAAKIPDGEEIRHRMGDVGYLDSEGRLWLCGRKTHRVITQRGTMFTLQCEAIFNEHPRVFRSALVGIGEDRNCQTPAIVIETEPGEGPRTEPERQSLAGELRKLAGGNELTADIRTVLFHESFPVDIRHNAKIDRSKLARWAAAEYDGT